MTIAKLIRLLKSFKDQDREIFIYLEPGTDFDELEAITGALDCNEFVQLEIGGDTDDD